MTFRLPLCFMDRHAPNRRGVRGDGLNYVATCKFCSTPIRRHYTGRWQKDWIEKPEIEKGASNSAI